jgi:hypothetical protein
LVSSYAIGSSYTPTLDLVVMRLMFYHLAPQLNLLTVDLDSGGAGLDLALPPYVRITSGFNPSRSS